MCVFQYPWVFQSLGGGQSRASIQLEQTLNEVFSFLAYVLPDRTLKPDLRIEPSFDQTKGLVIVLPYKRQFSGKRDVSQHTDRPHVALKAIVPNKDFRRYVQHRAYSSRHPAHSDALRRAHPVIAWDLRRIREADQFDSFEGARFRQQYILSLDVPVTNASLVHEVNSLQELLQHNCRVGFRQMLAFHKLLKQGPTLAKLIN